MVINNPNPSINQLDLTKMANFSNQSQKHTSQSQKIKHISEEFLRKRKPGEPFLIEQRKHSRKA